MNLSETVFTTFDFETTGLFAGYGDQICEIGALRREFDGPEKKFEQLVDPMRPISAGAYNINRISPDMIKGQPVIDEVLPGFMEFITGTVLVAYNARFDISFLAAALGKDRTILNDYLVIDVLELARSCFTVPGGYSLGNVTSYFKIKQDVEHRAMADVVATWEVFNKAVPILREQGVENVEDIARVYHQTDVPVIEVEGPVAEILYSAISAKCPVRIKYRSAWNNNSTERVITPLKIQGEYVYSFCHLRGENRTFLIECIEQAMEVKNDSASQRP